VLATPRVARAVCPLMRKSKKAVMEFHVLSHACLLVRTASASVVVDPWLLGTAYWRSWAHFPPAQIPDELIRSVDAVLISHIHWDHWHGLTLKKLFPGKPVLIPDEPGLRSGDDLAKIGFRQVRRVPHGATVKVGDLRVTFYQFGLYINDSAIVIESDEACLLNVNDCKIAGAPLAQILRRHPRIDFAFRSHSSANPRACFRLMPSGEPLEVDDDDQYFASFCAFMDVVNPRFAVPFASNNCHVHPDSIEFNVGIANPRKLAAFIESRSRTWEFAMMLPGSVWSSATGFKLADTNCFDDPSAAIARLIEGMSESLERSRQAENEVVISQRHWDLFRGLAASSAGHRRLAGSYLITIHWPDGRLHTRRLDVPAITLTELSATTQAVDGLPVAVFPAVVFRDAVTRNMFHHACVSKRCRFYGNSASDLWRLRGFMVFLEFVELQRFPLRLGYARRLALAYVLRWRELLVYAQAVWFMKFRGLPVYKLEQAILGTMRRQTR
jgi:UDP-MurNAc hydroxylase